MSLIRVLTEEDTDLINEFLFEEVIFRESFEDGEEIDFDRRLDFKGWAFLGCFNEVLGGELEALTEIRMVNSSTLELHFKAKSHIRGVKALKYARETIDYIFGKLNVNKLNVVCPEYRKQNQRFAALCGFKREGLSRESFLKNGKYWDQVCYGLTRGEYGF
jgi:hypothetical protein